MTQGLEKFPNSAVGWLIKGNLQKFLRKIRKIEEAQALDTDSDKKETE